MAGFDYITDDTDVVAIVASDLQDPPEVIADMVKAWRAGSEVVYGVRRNRPELELLSEPVLSICCFRYRSDAVADPDAFNTELLRRLSLLTVNGIAGGLRNTG